MIEQLKAVYANYRWAKSALLIGPLLCGVLLYTLSGGFPPWAWLFLLRVYPQIPRLWSVQGTAILLPLIGLVLLSIALLIIWAIIILVVIKVLLHWWQTFRERQHFATDLQEAERLAEQMVRENAREGSPIALVPQPQKMVMNATESPQQSYAFARSARVLREVMPSAGATTFPVSLSRQQTERRVHMPPLAAPPPLPAVPLVREQLRIVPPMVEDEKDDEIQIEFDEILDVDIRDNLPILKYEHDSQEQERNEQAEDRQESNDEQDLDELDIDLRQTLPGSTSEAPKEVSQKEQPARLIVSVGLDPGLARKDAPNEDNLCAIQGMRVADAGPQPVGLFVVADGMGGHANGQEASRLAVQAMSDVIVPGLLHSEDADESFLELLREGVHRANLAIYRCNREQAQMMGTTLTAALVVNATAYVANVGDSRTYLYRKSDGLEPITRDHSMVARMVENGLISREDVYTHPKRNQIYRCLGEHATVEVDTFVKPLCVDDILLLCSDGLWEMVRDGDMSRIIASSTLRPSQISAMLIQAALAQGGADNISAVVVHMAQAEE